MSRIDRCSLTHGEAFLLLQCGSFWPDSMVDKSSFMKMLFHVMNVEAQPDIQTERWEEELIASGACDASGVVDVRHFVSFSQEEGVEGAETVLGLLSRLQQEDKRLAAPSEPPSKNMLANHPAGGDMSSSSWTLSTA
eukprot:5343029-Amphidinium_carterae.1